MRSIDVHTPSRSYAVTVGDGVLSTLAEAVRAAGLAPRAVHVVVDANVPPGAAATVREELGKLSITPTVTTITPSEPAKSLQTLQHILQDVTAAKLERRDLMIALGGGIVGDITGFAASTYRRGIAWINLPTTLLSMVDASVGGKTGVNIRAGADLHKNMVGAFWQPHAVIADVSTLHTLTAREYVSGLAECVKHAMLSAAFGDEELMAFTKASLAAIGARTPRVLEELIARNIGVKARVVGGDEREEAPDAAGGRALLNLGHTFGHAIETIPSAAPVNHAAPLTHGEAVALGLMCATRYAELSRALPVGSVDELRTLLKHIGLPSTATGLPGPGEIVDRMGHDKKAAAGRMRLVVPCGPGRCQIVADPAREMVMRAVEAIVP